MTRWRAAFFVVMLLMMGCADTKTDPTDGDDPGTTATNQAEQLFPDVIDAVAHLENDGTYTFEVTVSSPYDSPERYADAWRILAPDGSVLGVRELLHDHAGEQPFTRSLGGVEIPDGMATVTVEGRDLENGWGGKTVDVDLP